MHITPILLCLLPCLVWGEDTTAERNKRSLGMLRMGKRSLQMLRMGRSVPDNEYPNYDNSRDDHERTPPMPRLGKNLQSLLNDDYRRYMDEEAVYDIAQQLLRNSAEHNSRLARSTQTVQDPEDPVMDRERSLPRLGLRDELPRLGLRDDEAALEDAELPRMGLRSSERSLPFPRLGYRDAEEKRAMSMLRMGKRGMSMLRMGKRPVSMLRMGRSDGEEQEKRAMSMLRMGKRAMSMLRMGKRPMSMLRMGKKDDYVVPSEEKRAMSMLRMGKRYNNEEYKRAMSMLRMGKRAEGDQEKRALGMLRMGKRELDTNNSQAAEKKDA